RSAFQRLETARDLALGIEWIDPPETRPLLGADVPPEQEAHQALVGLQHNQSPEQDEGGDQTDKPQRELIARKRAAKGRRQQPARGAQAHEAKRQHQEPIAGRKRRIRGGRRTDGRRNGCRHGALSSGADPYYLISKSYHKFSRARGNAPGLRPTETRPRARAALPVHRLAG